MKDNKQIKIIQSFWGGKDKRIDNSYGWHDSRFHWLGWMLSCHQLRKYYDRVELYTDEFGYDMLIRKLKLPYTKVHVVLDELNDLPGGLWAMAKIKVYSMQDEPFLHVDGDVFIFEPFSQELMSAPLIAQNLEVATTGYCQEMWTHISPHLTYLPQEMDNFHHKRSDTAYNMGIAGGNNIDFFKKYTRLAYEFVYNNKAVWDKINLFNFNIFFEQFLFCACAKEENIRVGVLLPEEVEDNGYTGFDEFESVPEKRNYLHLLGAYKRDSGICHRMMQYCWYHHPEWVKTLFEATIPNWKKDFYFEFTKEENKKLTDWYTKHIDEQEISPKRLIARDLFTFEQNKQMVEYEKNEYDYQVTLLPEVIFSEIETEKSGYRLIIKDFFNDSYIRDLDQLDEVIFFELNSPKRKSELFNAILGRFETDLSMNERKKIKAMLIERIEFYISRKIIWIKE
jgi:hypothetical protein